MRLKWVRRGIVHVLAIVAVLIFVCACADEAVNQSKIHSSDTSSTNARENINSYKIIYTHRNMGNAIYAVQPFTATIHIDITNNRIFMGQLGSLQFVNNENGKAVFFQLGGWLLQIENAGSYAEITHGVVMPGQPYVWDEGSIPKSSFHDFYAKFNQLKFPQNFHGLVATMKYIDGNPMEIRYEFVASMQLVNSGCLLNSKAARFFRQTLANGNGVIVVNNGDSNLVLWPDGNWLFSNLDNSGISFGGFDDSLKQVYSDLRKRTEEPASNNPTFTGTGFFITDDGYLISNYHVVKDATKVRLVTSAGLIEAKVVQIDAANDLALLKADGRFAPLPIAASRTVNLGGTVATIGFPNTGLQGFAPKLAKGEIASLSGAADDPRYFQISVPVQPGNSGGALVDERGNVIGIVSAKLNASVALAASGALPENVNYAVKSSFLLSFLESVPAVSARLKTPVTADRKFEEVVKSAQDAAVLVLVY
jgi:S1-C subfamily serine protease